MKPHWRRCPRCVKASYHWPYESVIPNCPTCKGRGKIRVRKPERVCRPNPDTKFTRHWNIRAGKRGMKASVAFQRIGKK